MKLPGKKLYIRRGVISNQGSRDQTRMQNKIRLMREGPLQDNQYSFEKWSKNRNGTKTRVKRNDRSNGPYRR